MTIVEWFARFEKCVPAGAKKEEVTLRILAPGKLYEAQFGRKKVVAVDVEGALNGLLVAMGGEL